MGIAHASHLGRSRPMESDPGLWLNYEMTNSHKQWLNSQERTTAWSIGAPMLKPFLPQIPTYSQVSPLENPTKKKPGDC